VSFNEVERLLEEALLKGSCKRFDVSSNKVGRLLEEL